MQYTGLKFKYKSPYGGLSEWVGTIDCEPFDVPYYLLGIGFLNRKAISSVTSTYYLDEIEICEPVEVVYEQRFKEADPSYMNNYCK